MERTGLVLVLAVGILSTSSFGYQLPARKFFSKTTDNASNFVRKQKQNDFPLNIPENASPVENSHILFPCHQDGLFAYPHDCTLGVSCSGGVGQLFTCTDILHFNNVTKECDSFCSAHCDPLLACPCRWDTCETSKLIIEESATDEVAVDKVEISFTCIKDGLYPDPMDCNQFIQCANDRAFFQKCPPGLQFNRERKVCDWPENAACDQNIPGSGCDLTVTSPGSANCTTTNGRTRCDITCDGKYQGSHTCRPGQGWTPPLPPCAQSNSNTSTQMSPREEGDTGDFYEEMPGVAYTCHDGDFYPDHRNCHTFYECSHGRILIHICFPGYHYNKKTNRCDTPCNAKCDPKISCTQKRIESVTKETPVAEDRLPSSGLMESSKKVFKLKVTFVCLVDGLFPKQGDCGKYLNCSNGTGYELSCPPGRHFNNVTKQCETFCSAQCDPNVVCDWRDNMLDYERHSADVCNSRGENIVYVNRYTCDIYYKCEGHEYNKFRCPNGQHSNPATRRCQEPCDAKCDMSLAEECDWNFGPAYERKAAIRYLCSRGPEYAMGFKDKCDSYIKCNVNITTLYTCLPGRHFIKATRGCGDPCIARCDPNLAEQCGWTPEFDIGEALATLRADEPDVTLSPLKSSNQLCSKDGTYLERNPLDCSTYFKCMDGDADLFYCPDGQHFNQQTLRCEDACDAECDSTMAEKCGWKYTLKSQKVLSNSLKQPVFDFECPGDGLYPNIACENFIQCTDGQAYLIDCPRGLHYEPLSDTCTTPCEARCDPNYELYCKDEEKKRAPKQLMGDFDCETDGYHTNPVDCGSFIQCFNGDAYAIYCPADLHYSPTKEICVTRCEAKCAPNYEEYCRAEEWNRRRKLQHNQSSPAKQPFPLVSEYICGEDGDYPNPENCNSYITCILGESFYKDCPVGLHFSETTQNCESPCDARCQSSIACDCDWDTCDEIQETSDEVDCEAEFDEGPCRGRFPRYAYDAMSGRCRGFLYGGCSGNSNNFRTMEECENKCRKKLLRGFRCPSNTGMFGNYPDCLSYYHCKRGMPTLKRCPKGKAFDHKKSKCVTEHEATCLYECRDRDAAYPYEEDCRKYVDCVNGIPKLERCPTGKAFDPEEKNCIDEKQVETCFWE